MTPQLSRRQFIIQCGRCAALTCSLVPVSWKWLNLEANAQQLKQGYISRKLSPYFTALDNLNIRCELCPHGCEVAPGDRGFCEVRENVDGKYYSLVYGNPCAVHVDPVEKKPLFHVLPGTQSFSIATAGCNFDCEFCQNWEISQARPENTYNYDLPSEQVVQFAKRYNCRTIASTYVEPTIFIEYMLDIGRLAKPQGILNVMHSNGFINERPLKDLCLHLDAACIDLKGFTESYYRNITEGSLQPVLDTLKRLRAADVHIELVNLVIPGKNDAPEQIRAMCRWIREQLGPGTPLHFSRFYPRYKLKSVPPTPVETLEAAHDMAIGEGLHFVYIGNVPNHRFEHTYCPKCRDLLIHRVGYQIELKGLKGGQCGKCGEEIPGIWQ